MSSAGCQLSALTQAACTLSPPAGPTCPPGSRSPPMPRSTSPSSSELATRRLCPPLPAAPRHPGTRLLVACGTCRNAPTPGLLYSVLAIYQLLWTALGALTGSFGFDRVATVVGPAFLATQALPQLASRVSAWDTAAALFGFFLARGLPVSKERSIGVIGAGMEAAEGKGMEGQPLIEIADGVHQGSMEASGVLPLKPAPCYCCVVQVPLWASLPTLAYAIYANRASEWAVAAFGLARWAAAQLVAFVFQDIKVLGRPRKRSAW